MMRQLLFLLLVLPLFGASQELKMLRLEYPTAVIDMHTTEALLKSLANASIEDEPILAAYKGALLTIQARNTKGVSNKISYFKEGKTLLENAISEAPKNIEIRCLRMGVQENSPKIVRYKSNIEEDKNFLIDNFKSVKIQEVKDLVEGYVRQSALFTDVEKELF